MSTKTIYIVYAHTGEYDDIVDWPVCAYYDKDMAEDHALRATVKAKELIERSKLEHDDPDYIDLYTCEIINPYDPRMVVYYSKIHYDIVELEIK